MNNDSVYQSETYLISLKDSGDQLVEIGSRFKSVEREISISFLGKRKILEARGDPSKENLRKFKKKSKKYFYGTISPTVVKYSKLNFSEFSYRKVSNHTILIDLEKSEDELWKNLEKKSSRWGVKTAQKNELKFEKASKKDVGEFYKLYEETAKNGEFKAKTKDFVKNLADSEVSQLFVVKQRGDIVCGGLLLIDKNNNYSILDLTASSGEGMKLQAMPFLYWNLLLYSKKFGLGHFDLGGYDREAKRGDKTYNINKFKERFGGEITEQPIYATNWKYPFLRGVLRKLKFLKRLYKKA